MDDSFKFDFSNDKINTMLSNLFRLIRLKQNLLAYELAKRIIEIIDIPEVKLIIDNIDYSEDNINYTMENLLENDYKKPQRYNINLEKFLNNENIDKNDKNNLLSQYIEYWEDWAPFIGGYTKIINDIFLYNIKEIIEK